MIIMRFPIIPNEMQANRQNNARLYFLFGNEVGRRVLPIIVDKNLSHNDFIYSFSDFHEIYPLP